MVNITNISKNFIVISVLFILVLSVFNPVIQADSRIQLVLVKVYLLIMYPQLKR